jgi:hypothetical protein
MRQGDSCEATPSEAPASPPHEGDSGGPEDLAAAPYLSSPSCHAAVGVGCRQGRAPTGNRWRVFGKLAERSCSKRRGAWRACSVTAAARRPEPGLAFCGGSDGSLFSLPLSPTSSCTLRRRCRSRARAFGSAALVTGFGRPQAGGGTGWRWRRGGGSLSFSPSVAHLLLHSGGVGMGHSRAWAL